MSRSCGPPASRSKRMSRTTVRTASTFGRPELPESKEAAQRAVAFFKQQFAGKGRASETKEYRRLPDSAVHRTGRGANAASEATKIVGRLWAVGMGRFRPQRAAGHTIQNLPQPNDQRRLQLFDLSCRRTTTSRPTSGIRFCMKCTAAAAHRGNPPAERSIESIAQFAPAGLGR